MIEACSLFFASDLRGEILSHIANAGASSDATSAGWDSLKVDLGKSLVTMNALLGPDIGGPFSKIVLGLDNYLRNRDIDPVSKQSLRDFVHETKLVVGVVVDRGKLKNVEVRRLINSMLAASDGRVFDGFDLLKSLG